MFEETFPKYSLQSKMADFNRLRGKKNINPRNQIVSLLVVALIAGSSPIGCIFGGLLYGGLLYGGQSVQSAVGAPSEIINIMIGTIVFFVALTKVVPVLADRLLKRGGKNVK